MRLVLGAADSEYTLSIAESPSAANQGYGRNLNFQVKPNYRTQVKTNFWEENLEVPSAHTYSNELDLKACKAKQQMWNRELREKKQNEMAIFNGKREVNINEGETASSFSQSRVSHKTEKAQQIQKEAQERHKDDLLGSRKAADGRTVNFALQEPVSPGLRPDGEADGDSKADLKDLEKFMSQNHADVDLDVDDMGDRGFSTLEDFKKRQSRLMRDEEAQQEIDEEEKELADKAADIKQYFIDNKTGKQYDPDKRFGLIQDGTQLVHDNITTSYELNLPPDYYLKYIQDQMRVEDKMWFIRPHHVESLTSHFNSLRDDVLNTRYFSHYNRDKEVELSHNEQAIEYIETHLEKLRSASNAMELTKTDGERDFDQKIEDLKKETHADAYREYQRFIKDKLDRPDSKKLCIEAYEHILTHERVNERTQLNRERF